MSVKHKARPRTGTGISGSLLFQRAFLRGLSAGAVLRFPDCSGKRPSSRMDHRQQRFLIRSRSREWIDSDMVGQIERGRVDPQRPAQPTTAAAYL